MTEQLVRKPVARVFAAFVEPRWLTRFWLASASGPLKAGQKVRWEFMVEGAADNLQVLALKRNRLIRVRWSDGSVTEWTFMSRGAKETVVRIEQSGFKGTAREVLATALEATQGYTLVLSGLKVLLEGKAGAQLVGDKAELIERAMRKLGRKAKGA